MLFVIVVSFKLVHSVQFATLRVHMSISILERIPFQWPARCEKTTEIVKIGELKRFAREVARSVIDLRVGFAERIEGDINSKLHGTTTDDLTVHDNSDAPRREHNRYYNASTDRLLEKQNKIRNHKRRERHSGIVGALSAFSVQRASA